jgi:hypothetical protein
MAAADQQGEESTSGSDPRSRSATREDIDYLCGEFSDLIRRF